MTMRRVTLLLIALVGLTAGWAQTKVQDAQMATAVTANDFPKKIYSGLQDAFHVQGVVYDAQRRCIYLSFTTSLIKIDLEGRLLASVVGLTGHLGSIGLNPDDGRLYGSIEYKHDVIGTGIMGQLGVTNDALTGFYIAIFDLDKLNRVGMASDEVMTTVYMAEVVKDFQAVVQNGGRQVAHRYGASGIDGLTFAPKWGKRGGPHYLYVAYGVYADTLRTDNDYQVLLCYDVKSWKRYAQKIDQRHIHQSGPKKPQAKYFVYTGNTDYGLQNLEYDAATGYMFAAAYPGIKSEWPRYTMFVLDVNQAPTQSVLQGVEPRTEAPLLSLVHTGKPSAKGAVWGWERTAGSMGITSLGNGLFYLSHGGRDRKTKRHFANLCLYRWSNSQGFVRQE